MKLPVIQGTIDRRILVNYRVDPAILAELLPAPFRPQLVGGCGIAGICLIRLQHLRPWFVPKALGIGSENAAHRIAVEWEQNGESLEGVFIPRRDTASRLSVWVGGRLFPGMHHHARFQVDEQDDHYHIILDSDDAQTHLNVAGHIGTALPKTSVFDSVQAASDFFERGSLGYSTTSTAGEFDGLELRSFNWSVRPLAVDKHESSFFEDKSLFPLGSVEFDSALVMKGIDHEWHARAPIIQPRRDDSVAPRMAAPPHGC